MSRAFPLRVLVLSALVALSVGCSSPSRARYGPRTLAPAWSWVNPLPQGHTLYDVWSGPSGTWVAVGAQGTVLLREGADWRLASSGTSEILWAVWGSASNDIFAVGDGGTILHFDGFTWSIQESGTDEDLRGVYGFASDDVFAVGMAGTVLRWNGSEWLDIGVGSKDLFSVWGSTPADVIAVGEGGYAQVYDGTGWAPWSTGLPRNLKAIIGWGSTSDSIAVGNQGRIVRFDGSAWTGMSTPSSRSLQAIWGSSATDVYASGNKGTLLHFDGSSWEEVANFSDDRHLFGGTTSSSTSWVVGRGGVLFEGSLAAGWTEHSSGFDDALSGVWVMDESATWVVGPVGKIGFFDGSSWTDHSGVTTRDLEDVWAHDTDLAFAVGAEGTILRWDGSAWSAVSSGVSENLNGVWGAGSADVYGVGEDEVVLHFDGSGWTRASMPPTFVGDCEEVWGSDQGEVWIATTKGLWYSDGATWSEVRPNGSYTGGWSSYAGNTTFCTVKGSFGYSGPNGSDQVRLAGRPVLGGTWWGVHGQAVGEAGTAALWAVTPNDSYFSTEETGTGGDLLSISGSLSSNVLAVGAGGRVLRHDKVWNQLGKPSSQPFADHALHDLWVADTKEVFVVGSDGEVFRQTGSSWTNLNAPPGLLLMAVHGFAADDLWVGSSEGKLLHYDGAGWTTHDPGPGTWGFFDFWAGGPNDLWAVGEYGGVAHYDGASWTFDRLSTQAFLSGVWGSSANNVYAVDSDGAVHHYDGTGWSVVHSAGIRLGAVWGTGPNDVFVAGNEGRVLHFDGTAWTRMRSNSGLDLDSIAGSGPDNVWVGGNQAELLHYDGQRWARCAVPVDDLTTPGREDVQGLWMSPSRGPYVLSRTRVMVLAN